MLLILADECVNGILIRDLHKAGFTIEWVRESHPGILDEEVIALAKSKKHLIITEDKDFGEWVFAHQVSGLTIIFLQYSRQEYPTILKSIVTVLKGFETNPGNNKHEFITISGNKIRRREI